MFATIQSRLVGIFLGFVLLIVAGFAASYVVLQQQADDGLLVNLAGRQRMLTQKMTKESMLLVNAAGRHDAAAVDEQKDSLRQTMRVFEMTLFALKDGGNAPINLEQTKLRVTQAPNSPELKKQLEVVAALWVPFRENLDAVVASSGLDADAVAAVAATNVGLLKEMNKGVSLMQHASESKVGLLYLIQSLALGLGVLLVGIGVWLSRQSIVAPLAQLTRAARAMSTGDLNVELNLGGTREVAELGASFDRMRASLVAAFAGGLSADDDDDL